MAGTSQRRRNAELLRPSILYPFNKLAHALLRFGGSVGGSFSVEGVVDFTAPAQEATLPGDHLETRVTVTNEFADLRPHHQLLMLDAGVPPRSIDSKASKAEFASRLKGLLEHAAHRQVDVIWLTPPGEQARTFLREHELPLNVVSQRVVGTTSPGTVDLDDLSARRVVVAGTGPCIGKYTTALLLEHELNRQGLETSSIATEESGFLLSEFCLANLGAAQRADALSVMLRHLDDRDFVLSSGQGGVLDPGPREWYKPWQLTYQMAHFQEFRPQSVILQVRPDDPSRTIEDAVTLIRIMSQGKAPIAVVVSCARETTYQQYQDFDDAQIRTIKRTLQEKLQIPVFEILRDTEDLELLATTVAEDSANATP